MEVRNPALVEREARQERRRNRCSMCKQEGHNRARCPHDVWTQASLREQYRAHQREWVRVQQERVNAYFRAQETQRSAGPGRCKMTIQSILFDNAQDIPDGVYKQLMDALLIKD